MIVIDVLWRFLRSLFPTSLRREVDVWVMGVRSSRHEAQKQAREARRRLHRIEQRRNFLEAELLRSRERRGHAGH
jgi:DNA-binding transcriptional regulator GbsR (MarR family)